MQVKIGTKYKLGNGDIVTIVAVNPDVRDPYQYAVGWLDNAIESWSKEGRYCPSIPKSKLNIVSEIP